MNWFISIFKIAGASFPGAASFAQLLSEIDSEAILNRVKKLEDPISFLHDDVPTLSKLIYQELKAKESINLSIDANIYSKYSRPLAALEAQGYIKGIHTNASRYYGGIYLCDPSFIMYLCALSENKKKMEELIKKVDSCEIGAMLDGKEIKKDIDLPLPVIRAVFDIYESKGYGICSKSVGLDKYMGKA